MFAFNNPEVSSARVNIRIEQQDIRMLPSTNKQGESVPYQPPYNEKRNKIGFAVLKMSNAQSNIVQFEPPQLMKIVKQQGSRVASASLDIENKKYCVIPFTGRKGDISSLYITF